MIALRLTVASLWNRRVTAGLTLLGIAVSVALLLGVQKIRADLRANFANTVSGADLIVGARTGPVNLLLSSIFRIGDATSPVSWSVYQRVAGHPDVAWTIPLSLGDSHNGFRVLGTTDAYFNHYRYARTRSLEFAAGRSFAALHDAVVGVEVAEKLGYRIGQEIILSHGVGEISFTDHGDHPFTVSGILARTGTPADRTVHISLAALETIHGVAAAHGPGEDAAPAGEPQSITAFIVGLENRAAAFQIQRAVNEYRGEALTAILPGVALQQLWDTVGIAESALLIVAGCVVLAGLLGLVTAILTSLNERRREMAILRAVGAHPGFIFLLLLGEAAFLGLAGVLAGMLLLHGTLALLASWLANRFGIFLSLTAPGQFELLLGAGVVLAAVIAGIFPAWRAYRNTLADGLTIRI